MKKSFLAIILCITVIISTKAVAQQKTYKDGSVWAVSFIKVSANMGDEYLNNLKGTWKAVHDEAIKQGILLSYKILSGASSNPQDWDIMLMTEYKNLASMEGNDEKWDAIYQKLIGSEDVMKKMNESRASMRSIYGEKLLREIIYK